MYTLVRGRSHVCIDPNGGYVHSWKLNQTDILFVGSDPKRRGIPVLFPYFGRPSSELPQHGFGRLIPWHVQSCSAHSISMSLTHADLSEEITYYPYCFHASIEVDMLNENTMQYKLYVKNTDDRPLPVSPGLHPYWNVSHTQKRNVILSGLKEFDPSHIDWDMNPPDTDYAFDTTVSLQTDRYQLHIVCDGGEIPPTQITVWSQPISTIDRDFICVEPIAGMRGGYVSAPHVIPAGSTHRMCVKFIVTEEHL